MTTSRDELHRLIDQLPDSELEHASRLLRWFCDEGEEDEHGMTAADRAWMESDLSNLSEYEPYDWGENGPPPVKPIKYVPGVGFVIMEAMEPENDNV